MANWRAISRKWGIFISARVTYRINIMYTSDIPSSILYVCQVQQIVANHIALWTPMQEFAFSAEEPWGRCLTQFLKTRQQYAPILAYFLSHPAKMPDLYTQEDVYRYLSLPCRGQRNKGGIPSVATSNQRLAVLKSWYSFAATFTIEGADGHPERLLTTIPPTFGLKGGKPHIEYRALSFDEMERLFAVIPTDTARGLRDRALFLTYFYTARRRNEIAQLLWGDIEQATLIDKDQRREGWVYRWQGKGHVGKDDPAELPLPAKQAIDKYLVASGRMET